MGGEAEHLKLLEERQLLRHRRHRKPELHEAVRLEAPGAGSIPLVHICYCIAVGLESKVGLTRHTRSARSRPPTFVRRCWKTRPIHFGPVNVPEGTDRGWRSRPSSNSKFVQFCLFISSRYQARIPGHIAHVSAATAQSGPRSPTLRRLHPFRPNLDGILHVICRTDEKSVSKT